MIAKFEVKGMHCAACSAIVEKTVAGLEGVKSVNVALLLNSAEVEFDGILRAVLIYNAMP